MALAWRAWRVRVCVVVVKVSCAAVFRFSSCALTTFVPRRALLLTGASVLGCWVVAPDINDSVNAPMIYDLFLHER